MKVTSLIFLFFSISACITSSPKQHPISAPLNARQDSYRQCYIESDSYQGRKDQTLGSISVKFTITNEGKVKDARITESDFKDANLHACLLDQIRMIKFPDVKEETEVKQPIRFTPVEQ